MRELLDEHRAALTWFASRQSEQTGWPDPLPSGLFLANKAKGIHKPKDWDHALSIRVMLSSDYEDGDIEFDEDGRWHFRYHQEGDASDGPEAEFTNRALLRNRDDGDPIGVMRQVSVKPNVQYDVLGLGRVIGYADGFLRRLRLPPSPQNAGSGSKVADFQSNGARTISAPSSLVRC